MSTFSSIGRATGAALVLLGLGATRAQAHVMPAHQGTIAVRGHQAYVALALPVALLREADDDRDGKLSVAEVSAHQDLLQRLVATRVHVADQSRGGRLLYAQVIVERLDDDTGVVARPASDVLVLLVAAFDAEPRAIRLRIDGLDSLASTDPDAGRIVVRASHPDVAGAPTESATLRPGHDVVTFFASAWLRALDAGRMGVDHIVHGWDHLLFLLTLILAGTGWRYWTSVISSFTVAHAAVLAFAANGHVPPVPGWLAESMISGSIVLMAVHAYRRKPRVLVREAMLAGACGFVHGLGIVDAVRALQSGGRPDLVTLAAFNGGVEAAQLAAVAIALVVLWAARSSTTTPRAVSA